MSGLAGLGLFLFGIWLLEDGLKQLSGRQFKRLLRKYTRHPLAAIAFGTLATAVLQSSSVVSLILLALVGARVIGLRNALGIVMGANLGTTFTGWIVTYLGFKFDVEAWVMPLVATGALVFTFTEGTYRRLASWGRALLGLGLLLLGLAMVKDAVAGLSEQVDLVQYAQYGAVPFALAGFVFTAIIQSSSATMIITLSALHSGVIELHSAAALVVGADLGTTVTVILGGLRGSVEKKQVALGQFLFNLATNIVALASLPWLLGAVQMVVGTADPLVSLVAFHSTFNVIGILIFLPLLGPFARFLEARTHGTTDLPAGYESLRDLDPRVPTAATAVLESLTRQFLLTTCELNGRALHLPQPPGPMHSRIVGERDFLSRYADYKELEGQIMQGVLEVEQGELTREQTLQLGALRRALQYAGRSAKDLRDVEHNLQELDGAADATSAARLEDIQRNPAATYDHVAALLRSVPPDRPQEGLDSEALEVLVELLGDCRGAYESSLTTAWSEGSSRPPRSLIEDLNITGQVYSSTKRLIAALREVVLVGSAGEHFDLLPHTPTPGAPR